MGVYVGIDFGTDGTGLAYALPTGEVFVHQKWKGYKRSVEVKPKTRILLDGQGNFLAFGQPATNSYITMGGSSKTDWMLFERFKMALYDDPKKDDKSPKNDENAKDKEVEGNLREMLTAVNGAQYPSDKVFIEALKYIKSQVFKFFQKTKLSIDSINDVQWILTVPAIWSEKAKYKMEQWAQSAGLTNKEISNHLKIVYEPDCASLSIQYEIQKLKSKQEKKLSIMKASKKQPNNAPNEEEKTEEVQNEEEANQIKKVENEKEDKTEVDKEKEEQENEDENEDDPT